MKKTAFHIRKWPANWTIHLVQNVTIYISNVTKVLELGQPQELHYKCNAQPYIQILQLSRRNGRYCFANSYS
jgi:hypothetical protein